MIRLSVIGFALLLASAASHGAELASYFTRGNTHFTMVAGSGYAFEQNYFILGASAKYFIVDGLNAGLAVESWSSADPRILKVTPSVQYVFTGWSEVMPYVGAFYRHTTIDGLPNLESTGAQVGIYMAIGNQAYFGLGQVHESYLDCQEQLYQSCTDSYTELSLTFVF